MFILYGYKLKINSLPQKLWNCEVTVNDYAWKNSENENLIEIAFSKFTSKTVILHGNKNVLKNRSLSCVVGGDDVSADCEPETAISIVSVAATFSNFSSIAGEITQKDISDNSVLLLPLNFEDIPLSEELEITKIFHTMMKIQSDNENNEILFSSYFLLLLNKFDKIVRNYFNNENYKENYYIKKADFLIENNFAKKLTLETIANELNISPVYFSTIYKSKKGITFSEQLLNVRMKHAEQMLTDRYIPTAKIAELCGFSDETYFRKKFKMFFGMNVREYRNIKNGITLYHEKPINKNHKL